jgi:hypothetical protein
MVGRNGTEMTVSRLSQRLSGKRCHQQWLMVCIGENRPNVSPKVVNGKAGRRGRSIMVVRLFVVVVVVVCRDGGWPFQFDLQSLTPSQLTEIFQCDAQSSNPFGTQTAPIQQDFLVSIIPPTTPPSDVRVNA